MEYSDSFEENYSLHIAVRFRDSFGENNDSCFIAVMFRDSFGENDDSCFDLLERYDNSSAILKLLQSRRREGRIPEDTHQVVQGVPGYLECTEYSRYLVYLPY